MPKIQKSPTQEQAEIVHSNIVSRGALFGCKTDREFGKKIGISYSTFANRRNDPSSWRLDELVRASIALNCSLSWLMTDHSKERMV